MTLRLGIELLDGARPLGRFAVPSETASGPFTIGREGQMLVPGTDVLPVHGVMMFQDGRLYCASASSDSPIRAGNQVVPTDWVELPIPCVLRIGARIAMRPFAYEAEDSRATPPPQALPQTGPKELMTRVGAPHPATAAAIAAKNKRLAEQGQPVRQTVLKPKDQTNATNAQQPVPDDTLVGKATRRLKDDWRRTSKLMKGAMCALPVVGLLLLAKPSHATNDNVNQPYAAQLPPDAPSALRADMPPSLDPTQPQAQGAQGLLPTTTQQPLMGPGQGTSNGRRAALSSQERLSQKRAVDFTFAGDYAGALAIYQGLSQAHPDDIELRTATNVILQKLQSRR